MPPLAPKLGLELRRKLVGTLNLGHRQVSDRQKVATAKRGRWISYHVHPPL